MSEVVLYQQINKDHAYWIEKSQVGQDRGGHTSGLLTLFHDGEVATNILFDVGLGTIEGLCDLAHFSWDWPLTVFVTHAHPDHHAELMILSEIWCKRCVKERRDPLLVHATSVTLDRLLQVHSHGFGLGNTLRPRPMESDERVSCGIFEITAIKVDHIMGSVIYVVEFGYHRKYKVIIGWDMKRVPKVTSLLREPSLALLDATTWTPCSERTGHTSVEELVQLIDAMNPVLNQADGRYGVFLVHYSGWEDPTGPMSDEDVQAKFRASYPRLRDVMGMAKRGQTWEFNL